MFDGRRDFLIFSYFLFFGFGDGRSGEGGGNKNLIEAAVKGMGLVGEKLRIWW